MPERHYTVADYGCGVGSYLKKTAELVGFNGKVYAVDVHDLAIEEAEKQKRKYGLKNVIPILSSGYSTNVPSNCIDLIYAMDMFHMVKETRIFLKELNRIIKQDGILLIESGHQSKMNARHKIENSGFWEITNENGNLFRCQPNKRV